MSLEYSDTILNILAQLTCEIQAFVDKLSENGILQHSEEWEKTKIFTIGGSQLATVLGVNKFSTVVQLVAEKLGLRHFVSNIKVQWGNLFELNIKTYVEWDKRTKIMGSDIFVPGPTGTSYSPDGLGAVAIQTNNEIVPRRVLFEFKCPYSRLSDGTIPDYYLPQIKYGMDILSFVDVGLFVQALFRRCAWEDIGDNPRYDKTLVTETITPAPPLAYGIIGFYMDENVVSELLTQKKTGERAKHTPRDYAFGRNWLNKATRDELVEWGDSSNNYMSNDLGATSEKTFKSIMNAFNLGILRPWYSRMVFVGNRGSSDAEGQVIMFEDMAKFEKMCAENKYLNYGVLPWKLLKVDYNYVEKHPGYVQEHLPKIREVIDFITLCMKPENFNMRHNLYETYAQQRGGGGFV